jgi:tetratricopeptide (TPR) repeat protein
MFYARYAAKRVTSGQTSGTPATGNALRIHLLSSVFYLLSLFFFACGLMSKAMLVTWPFVMLLLDYWPLQRLPLSSFRSAISALRQLVREKIPFFALSGISCVVTYLTQGEWSEAARLEGAPALLRLENAFVAYASYLGKTLWPAKLALPYVNPGHWSWLEVAGSALVVVGACLVFLWLGRRWPYLLVGWCWFWGTLIPVISLSKGLTPFMADRFTYLPSIGLMILIVWGVCELTRGWRHQFMALSAASGAAIVACLALSRQQLAHWENSETLFRHALVVTENNSLAHNNLGSALLARSQTEEACRQYRESIRLKPDYAKAHYNLGTALAMKGQTDEAIQQFHEAIRWKRDYTDAHYNLGIALEKKGQTDEAIRQFQEAIRRKPDYTDAHYNLGVALGEKGQIDEAIRQLQEAIRRKPDYADAHHKLAIALTIKGQIDEAIQQYQEALRLKPNHAEAHKSLGTALGLKGQTDEAIRQFQEAIRLDPGDADAHYDLGVALSKKGQIDESIRQYRDALRLKPCFANARKNLELLLAARAASTQPAGVSTNR